MQGIIDNTGKLLAIIQREYDIPKGLTFHTPPENALQVGSWNYNKGIELKAHRHISNPREVEVTQEVIVVVAGKVLLTLYDDNKNYVGEEVLFVDDCAILLSGFHNYEILADNTKVIEVKNGPFTSVEQDKEIM